MKQTVDKIRVEISYCADHVHARTVDRLHLEYLLFEDTYIQGIPCREKLIAPGMQRIEYAVIHKTRRSKKELHNIVDK